MTENTYVSLTEKGVKYDLYLPNSGSDYIQSYISERKYPYEVTMLRDIGETFKTAKRNAIFVDIGANVGNHSLYVSQVVGRNVVAFEPNPHLCAIIQGSIERNNAAKQVKIYPVALSDTPGNGRMTNLDPTNLGAQSIEVVPRADDTFQIVQLDRYDWNNPIGVIKIDVEGMASNVLKGAQKVISEHRPIVYVECLKKSGFQDVYKLMRGHNYLFTETFNATPTHKFEPVESLSSVNDYDGGLQFALSEYNRRMDKEQETAARSQ